MFGNKSSIITLSTLIFDLFTDQNFTTFFGTFDFVIINNLGLHLLDNRLKQSLSWWFILFSESEFTLMIIRLVTYDWGTKQDITKFLNNLGFNIFALNVMIMSKITSNHLIRFVSKLTKIETKFTFFFCISVISATSWHEHLFNTFITIQNIKIVPITIKPFFFLIYQLYF